MTMTTFLTLSFLIFIGVASFHHFGWEGLAVPSVVWLLMPYRRDER